MPIPQNVLDILSKLDASDKGKCRGGLNDDAFEVKRILGHYLHYVSHLFMSFLCFICSCESKK